MENDDVKNSIGNRAGLWNKSYGDHMPERLYDDPCTGKIGGGFLNSEDILSIEDWGCGFGGFKSYIGGHQEYRGIDGSETPAASSIEDLETYIGDVDAVHMRHVLEHNPGWPKILNNALTSFRKKMVLTLFTPYGPETTVMAQYPNFNDTGREMIDISFSREDIVRHFDQLSWFAIENIQTETQYGIEHMFFLER